MAGKLVETDALEQVAAALGTYSSEVRHNILKMKDAAQDCSDMGNDVYSRNAIAKLEECVSELKKTITEADELRERILRKKNEIEESGSGF